MNSDHSVVQGNKITTHLQFHWIHISVDIGGTNLPLVHNSFVTEHQKRVILPQMRSSLAYSILSKLDVFGDLKSIQYLQDMDIYSKQMKIEREFKHNHSHLCGTYVGSQANKKLALKRSY